MQPFAAVFRLGVTLRLAAYRRGWFKTRRLSQPVVSVGNLTTGGTGKTPIVALVAKILLEHGWKPSILTRGYGRRSKADLIVIEPRPARQPDAREVGDEPALLARTLVEIPLVVCADRFRAGKVAEERFQVDAHILDDGFQHWALARDLDLVVLDAAQELSDRRLLPAGPQREPLRALERAQVVVITRANSSESEPLEKLVGETHPAAKVFLSSTKLLTLVDAVSGQAVRAEDFQSRKATAFCGIGNPGAFFRDAKRWGFDLAAVDAFPDHHVYTEPELDRLVARARENGASFMLTTEKDAVKFPWYGRAELPILACVIEAQFAAAEEFERTLLKHLVRPKKVEG